MSRLPKYRFPLFLLWILSIGLAAPVQANQLTLTAFDYPPYMDQSLPSKGVFCELVAAAYKASGYEVHFRFYPLRRSTQYVMNGTVLGQLGTEWNFPATVRERAITPVPLFYYRVVGFYRTDYLKDIQFQSLADLQGYHLGVIRGSSDAQLFRGLHSLTVEEVSHGEQLFKKLVARRNDIGFMAELSGLSILHRSYPQQLEHWRQTDSIIQGLLAQVVFSKAYPHYDRYVAALQQGIRVIRNNGLYTRILEKYYGKGKVPDSVKNINQKPYTIPKT